MKIWTEPYAGQGDRMGGAPAKLGRAPTLEQHRVIFVRVAGFTFQFLTLDQLRECLRFYAQRHQPSGRSAAAAQAVESGEACSRWEVERWHERLPLYLREEPKRVKVVAALEEALRRATLGTI